MTFTRAPYEIAAPALIAELDQIDDRFDRAHAHALEALSILSTFRDAADFGRPLVAEGAHGFVASNGVSIWTAPTLAEARAYALDGDRPYPAGRAIVEVDFTGAEPLFTRHALVETPPVSTNAGGIVFAALAELAAEEATEREADDLLRPGYVDDERELAAAELDGGFANAADFDVDFDPPEGDVFETVTAPVADPAKLEGVEAEIYAQAIARGIPAAELLLFEGEIWYHGAPLYLEDVRPAAPAYVDRDFERAESAIASLSSENAVEAAELLRAWDAGEISSREALDRANTAERDAAWQRIRSRVRALSR